MKRIVLLVCVFVYFPLRGNVWGDTIPPTLIVGTSISQYMDENINWESVLGDGLTQLWVDVKFIIYKNGTIGKLQIQSICPQCNAEVGRVIKCTDNLWKPYRIHGKIVDCLVSFRVPFYGK